MWAALCRYRGHLMPSLALLSPPKMAKIPQKSPFFRVPEGGPGAQISASVTPCKADLEFLAFLVGVLVRDFSKKTIFLTPGSFNQPLIREGRGLAVFLRGWMSLTGVSLFVLSTIVTSGGNNIFCYYSYMTRGICIHIMRSSNRVITV